MAQKWKPKPKELRELAWEYIEECTKATKEMATNKGAIEIRDRYIPTIDYFLRIWIPLTGRPTICRSTYYKYLADPKEGVKVTPDHQIKTDTIKEIDEIFKALALDIVANEGKGIFYAKNRLGMTDKQQIDQTANVNILNIDPLADSSKD